MHFFLLNFKDVLKTSHLLLKKNVNFSQVRNNELMCLQSCNLKGVDKLQSIQNQTSCKCQED